MSRSFKHQPFDSIGGGSAQWDKTQAARGVRRTHRIALHIALHNENFDIQLPHRRECPHNNVYSWCRDGKQRWCGLRARDWNNYIQAITPGTYSRFGVIDFWYGDEDYTVWPPTWYSSMMRK